ncbi:MAG: hypothetical protein ACTSUO_06290 [Candidatus Thorarchaeota archaeon]
MLNQQSQQIRSKLLRRYYKTAAIGWFQPRSLHWAKIVTEDGHWKWIRSNAGVRGKLLQSPPLHIYQTVLRIKSNRPPRGSKSSGFFLGGPLLFDLDIIPKRQLISIWKIADSVDAISELIDFVQDRGDFKLNHVMFSGSRGVHVVFNPQDTEDSILINLDTEKWKLRSFKRSRNLTARSVGYWCKGWDWKVSADVWRVSRVPWSIHGSSGLRAIPLEPPFTSKNIIEQIKRSSIFSSTRKLRVRITRYVPVFTFIDGETYGPFTKDWTTKLPLSIAIHLIWQGFAKAREAGPCSIGNWFASSWQSLFRYNSPVHNMDSCLQGGIRHG